MSIEVKSFHNMAYEGRLRKGDSPSLTLFIAFYNNVDFFGKVFASIETQTLKNFELIICDDGSREDAVQALKEIYKDSTVPVLHIWHPDRGFYKNEALNRGVLRATSEYFVFIDADCVLHPKFLEDHWNNKIEGHTLAGRRVNLTPQVTKSLSPEKIKQGYLQKNWWWLFLTMAWMKDNNSIKGFRVQSPWLYKILNRKPRGIVGCNFSVFKKDLLAVNGFDMSYHMPGIGEDSDVDFRLSGIGVTPIPMCFQGVQYHLYHKLLSRSATNEAKFAELKKTKTYVTNFGLKELEKRIEK
ncbi:glycosyltransferase [Bdellovibrio sp. 22V]|uniref:glycosyltransferase n=1 Tax=Bdellovibrio sp. 22V TaxID=3044166 RepID=UPI0025437C9D|nr:glycosyltransferase [Bdellovibrio sp. 22V]WII71844.1 glycosyltransferase [Bdellovibrio sp. 22V]